MSTQIAREEGNSTLLRAKFGPGMLLHHDDLELLNAYTRELSSLIFRHLLGCGVICGLIVSGVEECGQLRITVEPGLALDCNGHPVHVPKETTIPVEKKCEELPAIAWVVLCGKTKHCMPRAAMCASDDEESLSVHTREREAYEIRVLKDRPGCACGCDPDKDCYSDHNAGRCACTGADSDDCSCGCHCIILAALSKPKEGKEWTPDHSVRRFIRPVLMHDFQAATEKAKNDEARAAHHGAKDKSSTDKPGKK